MLAVVVFCLLFSGCETTGDPNQGGLFGWSEAKAIERQQLLRERWERASDAERVERQQAENLHREKARLQRQVAARDAQLQAWQREIEALQSALETGDISAIEATERAQALREPVTSAKGAGSEQLRADFEKIDRQIQLLTR